MAGWNRVEGLGLGLVRSHSFGRKRVVLSSAMDDDDFVSMKKHCSDVCFSDSQKSVLESLPQDVLIRIVCGVDHDDLKRLFHVSKAVREATLIAKTWHFEYSTPRKTISFKNTIDLEDIDEVEAPNAPRQTRVPRTRLSRKKLADLSIALFTTDGDENWPRRDLFMEMESEF